MDETTRPRPEASRQASARSGAETLCTCFAIRSAARQATQFYDRHLAVVGLTTTQFSILAHLAKGGPLSINALAARMEMDRTTMGRAVRPLERGGLVSIGPGQDGRTRALVVTDEGRTRHEAARPLWREAQSAFEAAYGAAEAEALRTALRRVRQVA